MGDLLEEIREQKTLVAALKATASRMKRTARETPTLLPPARKLLLLCMAESLIAAHKSAKIEDDGMTLDLIEDAMRHVGDRLAKEHGDVRDFKRKRLGPV